MLSSLWCRHPCFRDGEGWVHVGVPKGKVSQIGPLGTPSTVSTILLIGASVTDQQPITVLYWQEVPKVLVIHVDSSVTPGIAPMKVSWIMTPISGD